MRVPMCPEQLVSWFEWDDVSFNRNYCILLASVLPGYGAIW